MRPSGKPRMSIGKQELAGPGHKRDPCQNKANSAANRAKRTQFAPHRADQVSATRVADAVSGGANVQNEPNLPPPGRQSHPWDQPCKTNPISATGAHRAIQSPLSGASHAKRSQFPAAPSGSKPGGRGAWRAIAQNEANLASAVRKWARRQARGPRPRADCAKQTQFLPPGPIARNGANFRQCRVGRRSGDEGRREQTCKTNPICGSPRGTGILPVNRNHGQDAHATVPPCGVTTNRIPVACGAGRCILCVQGKMECYGDQN